MKKNDNNIQDNMKKSLFPTKSTNPIDRTGIVAKINVLGSGINSIKIPHTTLHTEKQYGSLDYISFINEINQIIKADCNLKDLLTAFHNMFVNKLNAIYTGIALINFDTGVLDLRILDRTSNVYSYKIFKNDTDNEFLQALKYRNTLVLENSEYLKIPSLINAPSAIIPVCVQGKDICLAFVSDFNIQNHLPLYNLAASNLGLLINNSHLYEKVSQSSFIDSLTNLYTHRRFHELLTESLASADSSNSKVSVLIFDINDMSKINKEYGHSKGDEVIKIVANKINENMKKSDVAARYGGDKISVILNNTNSKESKYIAEYLTYSLSCCLVDDIGPINKISVGIATYPDDSKDKDKLLVLAEQAVLVSKTKGYKNGISTIVSTQDFDFWDDSALNSFATVMAKRHSQIGINFEEALVEQFQNENILSQNHLIELVTSLTSTIDAKDKYTKDHSSSVSRYSVALAKAINLPEKEIERIRLGALLHDIGKIGIPEDVLKKPSKLTDVEFKVIQQHPLIGVQKILEPNPLLHDLIPIVKYHHEQWDGNGYPCKLKGEEIPLAARIVAIADTYHALISDRPYRKGLSIEIACNILEDGAGKQWDKELVRQFISIAPSLATKI